MPVVVSGSGVQGIQTPRVAHWSSVNGKERNSGCDSRESPGVQKRCTRLGRALEGGEGSGRAACAAPGEGFGRAACAAPEG